MRRGGLVDLGCVQITSASRVKGEREKIREHEREKESVKLEKKILSRDYSLVCRRKVHLFPHAR